MQKRLLTVAAVIAAGSSSVFSDQTDRVSLNGGNGQLSGASSFVSVSDDGRFVAFQSSDPSLPGYRSGVRQIYLRDRVAGSTTLVSRTHADRSVGSAAEGYECRVSGNGRFVVFTSPGADMLSSVDGNGFDDVYLWDRLTDNMERISVAASGGDANEISYQASISNDGTIVAFTSLASNLAGTDSNNRSDIYVRHRGAGSTTRISVSTSNVQATSSSFYAAVAGHGRYVAFASLANNLVSGDTNGSTDIFVRDLQLNTTTRVSLNSSGIQLGASSNHPDISDDGRYVTFDTRALNHGLSDTNGANDVCVRDTVGNTLTVISASSSNSNSTSSGIAEFPVISGDGFIIAYSTYFSDIVSATDAIVRYDRLTGTSSNVHVDSGGVAGNAAPGLCAINADGSIVGMESTATNLIVGDSNAVEDCFVHILDSRCAADFNADTVVDFFDYLDFVALFSDNAPNADFNADTVIDFFDYLDFVASFSAGC